jgi:ketopantoate reductase
VGAGGLGQSFAALLARNGEAVTLLATRRTELRLREAHAIRLYGAVGAEVSLEKFRLVSDPSALPPNAGVIFTTKGTDLAQAVESVRSVADEQIAWTAGIQNGVLKDDLLTAASGDERVIGAATIFGATRQADDTIRVSGRGRTYLGEHDGRMTDRVRDAAESWQIFGYRPPRTQSQCMRR